MGKSGSAYSGLSSLYNCHIVWSTTPNESANTSTVNVSVYADHHAIWQTVVGKVYINGSEVASTSVYLGTDDTSAHSTLIASGSATIAHNADGTHADITVSGSVTYNLTSSTEGYIGTRSCSTSASFDTIPRATTVFTVSNLAFGSKPQVAYTPNASTFLHKFSFACGTEELISGYVGQSDNPYILHTAIPNSWAQQFTESKTGTVRCTVYTYDANQNYIGSSYKDLSITYSGQPTVTAGTVSRKGSSGAFYPNIVQNVATVQIPVTTTENQNSEVKTATLYWVNGSSETALQTATLSNGSATFEVLATWSGARKFRIKATDARGNTGTSSDVTVSAYAYSYPQMSADFSLSGTTLTIKADLVITEPTLSSTELTNYGTLIYGIKKLDGTVVKADTTLSNQSTGTVTVTETAPDDTSTYILTIKLYDATGTDYQVEIVTKTATVLMSRLAGGNGVAFFDEATSSDAGRVRINGNLLATNHQDGVTEVGSGTCTSSDSYGSFTYYYQKYDSGLILMQMYRVFASGVSLTMSNSSVVATYYAHTITLPVSVKLATAQGGITAERYTWAGIAGNCSTHNGGTTAAVVIYRDSSSTSWSCGGAVERLSIIARWK